MELHDINLLLEDTMLTSVQVVNLIKNVLFTVFYAVNIT
jgi:hypothetical protein